MSSAPTEKKNTLWWATVGLEERLCRPEFTMQLGERCMLLLMSMCGVENIDTLAI